MGTRNLIAVHSDGEYKIAQYSQWDGYPSGQGLTVLNFLKSLGTEEKFEEFKMSLDKVYFPDDEELTDIDEAFKTQMNDMDHHISTHFSYGSENWLNGRYDYQRQCWFTEGSYTHLSRDVGGEILEVVYKRRDNRLALVNSIGFAGDGLFCEWAYVVDLDKGTFEVYEGFDNIPATPDSRFPPDADWLDRKGDYGPVGLKQSFDLYNLPSEALFLSSTENPDD